MRVSVCASACVLCACVGNGFGPFRFNLFVSVPRSRLLFYQRTDKRVPSSRKGKKYEKIVAAVVVVQRYSKGEICGKSV